MRDDVFIAGATGYMGRRLAAELLARGCQVRALVRKGSEGKVAVGCTPVLGDALNAQTYADGIAPARTFVHLVGVAHPSPSKAREFEEIDLRSLREAVQAATAARVAHFVYVSVAHPAPVMQAYIQVRMECERLIREAGLSATILRPWYVLGPGHRWPVVMKPIYWLAEQIPSTRDGARRCGLVTLDQMIRALVWSVENRPVRSRVLEVPEIRAAVPAKVDWIGKPASASAR